MMVCAIDYLLKLFGEQLQAAFRRSFRCPLKTRVGIWGLWSCTTTLPSGSGLLLSLFPPCPSG
jgi:hypothetical protein